jgi:hypothetical protein
VTIHGIVTAMRTSKEYPANDAICLYRNALSDELCDDLIELFESNGSKNNSDTSPLSRYTGTSTNMYLLAPESKSDSGIKTELDLKVFEMFNEVAQEYQKDFYWLSDCPELVDSGYRIQKYQAGKDEYSEHIDGDPWSLAYQGRVCGVVMYLNTVEDGGETYFPHQQIGIKPVKGTIAIFPANWTHPHVAKKPESNDKYVIATFLSAARFRHRNNYFVENTAIN